MEREQKPPPHGGLTHFACTSLEHIGLVMEQTPLNSAVSSVAGCLACLLTRITALLGSSHGLATVAWALCTISCEPVVTP